MKDLLHAPFVQDMVRTATNMYQHGWDERNGGNISLLLHEECSTKKKYVTILI